MLHIPLILKMTLTSGKIVVNSSVGTKSKKKNL